MIEVLGELLDQQSLAMAGIVIGICLSLSPIPTFIDIAIYSKSTGGYAVAPYVSAFMCASSWLTYALLAGSSKADLIPLNALSLFIYGIYCGVFLYYSDNRSRVLLLYVSATCAISLTLLAALFIKSLTLVGILAIIFNCLMFAAPLAVMNQVIITQSVRYMPFLLSLTSFLCASVWLVWAFIAKDYFVMIPNVLGTIFGTIQLLIYGLYWRMSDERPVTLARSAGREGSYSQEELTPMKRRLDEDTISAVTTATSFGGKSKSSRTD